MALKGTQITFGSSAVQLSSLLPVGVKQLDIIAASGNSNNVYIGSSAVTTTPTDAWASLEPGKSWGTKAEEGDQVAIGPDAYIIGTSSEKVHLMWVI